MLNFILACYGMTFILVYGKSGMGKTTDCGYSFPNALFVAQKGALQSIRHTCGYDPAQVTVYDLFELNNLLTKLKKEGSEYKTLVIDDFTILVDRTKAKLSDRMRDIRALYGKLQDLVIRFRALARDCDMDVILTCHERDPRTNDKNEFIRGGPYLSGKLAEDLPSDSDIVLRCGTEGMMKGFQGIYRCEMSTRFVMKCRFNICYHISPLPMNLGEILRAVSDERERLGYAPIRVDRHPNFAQQEELVEKFSRHLEQFTDFTPEVNNLYSSLLQGGISSHAARWTLRDAIDRTIIRRALTQKDSVYYAV